ncbi:hypothetical protein E2C01_090513 [Portunus trituberculatus]|uniref:Uncharacterized protein n=1 Tax=Portunus trituberculatus TaxID=210409 RepID=A0A5B7JKE1_PORTR|nr:hypothetical protein [Portunus trituberculatus]
MQRSPRNNHLHQYARWLVSRFRPPLPSHTIIYVRHEARYQKVRIWSLATVSCSELSDCPAVRLSGCPQLSRRDCACTEPNVYKQRFVDKQS